MLGRMAQPRRMLVTPAIVLGLISSIGATNCAADPPVTSSASAKKKATGSVVRCHGRRSCDVTFRRATTQLYFERLRGRTPPAVVSATTAEAACLLVTHTLTGHIVCAAGSVLLNKELAGALKRAANSKECLTVHVRAPDGKGAWHPISYGTAGGRDCAA
jgi:hypothetical protein